MDIALSNTASIYLYYTCLYLKIVQKSQLLSIRCIKYLKYYCRTRSAEAFMSSERFDERIEALTS
jgi:hypothetical protein